MRLATLILLAGIGLSLDQVAFAADDQAPEPSRDPASTQPVVRRRVQSASDAAPHNYLADDDEGGGLDLNTGASSSSKKKDYFGAHLMGYYDFLSSFSQLQSSAVPGQFASSTTTGSGGMLVLFTLLNSMNFEVSAGFDYLFPVNVQSQQSITGTYQVTGQSLNVMGLRLLQVGYQFTSGNFMLVPYGAVGLYYGRNVATMINTGFASAPNQITYAKLFSTFTFGVRAAVDVGKQHTFSLGAAAEGFMPVQIADQLSQLGSVNSEQPGAEAYIKPNMEFMNNFGVRVLADIRVLF